eukprot:TRINITY_DN6516_c0_g1_i1.p1 TRINITY_DN6516_c0_g1~~TRINITY_DN6516_c0_g1_i1.p1  ORF type:complete len:425 (-),score=55.25 TRINITY_DN6516_c0_g1_i1:97-1311(-)
MAVSLGSKPHLFRRILLLDAGPGPLKNKPSEKAPFQNRVLAVNPTSQELLKSLGAWDTKNTFPVNRMLVWDSRSNSKIQFDGEICSIAENGRIVDALMGKISNIPEITFLSNTRITKLHLPSQEGDSVKLELSDGSSLCSDIVIGADGINSLVRKAVSPQTLSTEYGQFGLVATLKFKNEVCSLGTAYQKFLSTGPIALLPLDKEHCSLVWTLPSQKAKDYSSLSEEDFLYKLNTSLAQNSEPSFVNEVNRCFDSFMGVQPLEESELESLRYSHVFSRAIFPLGIGHSVNYVNRGTALVGDAAHRIHPLAGLGANIGFSDVSTLTQKLVENLENGDSLGRSVYLKEYESIAQRSNTGPLLMTHLLQRMFCNESSILGALRGIGLNTVNGIQPLKGLIQSAAKNA